MKPTATKRLLALIEVSTGILIRKLATDIAKEGSKVPDDPVILSLMTVNAAARKMHDGKASKKRTARIVKKVESILMNKEAK